MNKSDVAREAIVKFPNATTKGLAEMLCKQQPDVFLTYNSARDAVRRIRGEAGDNRNSKDPIIREKRPKNAFADLPEGIESLEELEPYCLNGPAKVGIVNDLHIPYHDKPSVVLALEYLKKEQISHLLLNGDILDFYTISRWETDPRKRNLAGEIQTGRTFLKMLREFFGSKVTILYKEGNHEDRWRRYLSIRAPELLGMQEFELPQVLHFKEYDITHIASSRYVLANGMNVVHGHEWVKGISGPVNPARGLALKAKEPCITAHYHRTSAHTDTTMSGRVIPAWSTGCLCNLRPDYARFNNWNHGFGILNLDTTRYYFSNLKIVDKQIYP